MDSIAYFIMYFPSPHGEAVGLKGVFFSVSEQIVINDASGVTLYSHDSSLLERADLNKALGTVTELNIELSNGVSMILQPIEEGKEYIERYLVNISAMHHSLNAILQKSKHSIAEQNKPELSSTQKDSNAPILVANVGFLKRLIGPINLRSYSREDTLELYEDRITYTCTSDSVKSFTISLAELAKVKQRLQELHLYMKNGKKYSFEFGDPVITSAGIAAGGVIGLGIISKGVTASGINDWFTMLSNRGVSMDDSLYNTPKGTSIAVIRMFVWTVLVLVSLLLCVATYAAVIGEKGGKIAVFAVELPIWIVCVTLLNIIPRSSR